MNNFKKELTDKDIKHLQAKIYKHFTDNARIDRHNKMVMARNFNELDNYLGLAYTSSSSFAMLSVCNEEVYLDTEKQYSYNCFGIDNNGFAFACCDDSEENSLYIFI